MDKTEQIEKLLSECLNFSDVNIHTVNWSLEALRPIFVTVSGDAYTAEGDGITFEMTLNTAAGSEKSIGARLLKIMATRE